MIVQHTPPIPKTRTEIKNIFGDPKPKLNEKGNLVATNHNFRKQIVKVELPIHNKTVTRWIHSALADVLIDICEEILFYRDSEIDIEDIISDTQQIKTIG